jgi:GT2 family glycosyltransferase
VGDGAARGSGDGRLVRTIVFSKDRPLQLDATLRSLELTCGDFERAEVHVLFRTSEPRYLSGYRVLVSEHPTVVFHQEEDFKPDLERMAGASEHLLFLVDDTLFVGGLSLGDGIRALASNLACLGFSYRLGWNTRYCYTLDRPQRLPSFEELDSDVLTFDWTDADYDFGYPLEVSSSLYRTSDVLPLLRALEYRNPNTLERALAQHADSFRATRPRLACYRQSVALSVPANLVQTAWKNRVDGNHAVTAEALCDAYAQGKRLDVERYRGFVANAAHQELELFFTQRSDVPTVSVVIPCYGQAEYLPEAVASVVAQTFTDWELVIVDDGSPDDTALVAGGLIAKYPQHRIRLLRQANAGLSRARNAGIGIAKGRQILPLDADDMIAPTMLEQAVAILSRQPNVAIAYTDHERFGESTAVVRTAEFNAFLEPAINIINYCALYRREVWEAVGGYNPNMKIGYEDWDFWVGAVERGYRGVRIPEPLLRYRIRSGSMFTDALQHDAELRRQMRANHPGLYRPWLRAARFGLLAVRAIGRRSRRLLKRIGFPASAGRGG